MFLVFTPYSYHLAIIIIVLVSFVGASPTDHSPNIKYKPTDMSVKFKWKSAKCIKKTLVLLCAYVYLWCVCVCVYEVTSWHIQISVTKAS